MSDNNFGVYFSLAGAFLSGLSLYRSIKRGVQQMGTVEQKKEVRLIQPAPVTRDEYGNWYHPDIPIFYGSDEGTEDSPKWKDWLKEQGLEYASYSLESEDEDHPAYQSYYEKETADFSQWNPGPPDGEGWFLLSICDTEDGPYAFFVRRVAG